jgi:hypothetical protein
MQVKTEMKRKVGKEPEGGRGVGIHAEPVRRSENDTHPIVESDMVDATVDATVQRRCVDPNCVPKPFDPDPYFSCHSVQLCTY